MDKELVEAYKKHGFDIESAGGEHFVVAYGHTFPLGTHPFAILAKLFREENNPELKYSLMKRLHDLLWPQDIASWHTWSEERFRTYCEDWRIISWASGASGGKSVDAAKIILIDWTAAPKTTAAIIASTTIQSLKSRIYGYILSYLRESAIPLPYTLVRSQPPKVLFNRDDEIHSISALAAAKGSDRDAIKNYIGRHPKGKFILALDEAPDLDACILEALPNLEAGKDGMFKCISIGNSADRYDLHGALSTPKGAKGWDEVNADTDIKWETTQYKGVCQYFDCFRSPAIFEKDPVKLKAISKFLPTIDQIEVKTEKYGKDTEGYWRFVRGFWKPEGVSSNKVLTKKFLEEYQVRAATEFSGLRPLVVVAGLDPAFSVGGDTCLLQLGILGQDIEGNIVLDFRGMDLTFEIKILASVPKSAELQIAEYVLDKLAEFRCPLSALAVDATGQGRAIAEVIRLKAQSLENPIKIWSTKIGNNKDKSFDVIVKSSLELWTDLADFVRTKQIRGLSFTVIQQLTTREIEVSEKGGKKVLESKQKYKMRMGAIHPTLAHSPDEADGCTLCLQAAKIRYGFFPGQIIKINQATSEDVQKYLLHKEEKREAQERKVSNPPVATFASDFIVVPNE